MKEAKGEHLIRRLVEKARRGKLTLFAGAGVSKDARARIPLYHELAEDLYPEEWRKWKAEGSKGGPGAFFDEMKKVDPRLHEKLAQAVGRERDPSTLHHSICDLVERTHRPTVVTTNWDQLLEKAAEQRGRPFKVWPITKRGRMSGRQAHGVIHLNGSVENPKGMLATWQELLDHYGREEEKAFIEGLVEDRTILCVGYSHNDEMIGEIVRRTRQAGVQTEIITIIQEGNGEKETEERRSKPEEQWGAEVIWYPWTDRHHDSVKRILSRITEEEEEMRALKKMENIAGMARGGPKRVEDWSVVRKMLEEGGPEFEVFAQSADAEAWTTGDMVEQGGLGRIFGGRMDWNRIYKITSWLCGWTDELDEAGMRNILRLVRTCRGVMPVPMRHIFGIKVKDSGKLTARQRTMGGLVLLGQATAGGLEDVDVVMLMSIGEKCSKEGSEEVNLRTLEMLAEVVASPDLHLLWWEDAASGGDEGSATPKVPCSTHTVWMFWEERIKPIVENHRERVWQACTRGLRQQHAVVEATKAPSKSWNAWSYRRSAIEAHEQDERGDRSMRDVLIDGARDAMEQTGEAAQADRKTWERLVEICAGEPSPVLRRLAIHAVTETTHWTDEEKMRWWVSEKVCNDLWLHHEAYRLVKKVWRNATHETREDAATAIRRMSPTTANAEDKDKYDARARYDLIHWLEGDTPEQEGLQEEMARIREQYPQWRPKDHPDFLHWSSGGRWEGPRQPKGWEADKLVGEWRSRGKEAIDEVLDYEATTQHDDPELWMRGSNVEGVRDAITETAEGNMEWMAAVAQRLVERGAWRHEAWKALCKVLPKHAGSKEGDDLLSADWWGRVVGGSKNQAWSVGDMLKECGRRALDGELEDETKDRLMDATVRWLDVLEAQGSDEPQMDWMTWTINEPHGMALEGCMRLMGKTTDRGTERRRIGMEAFEQRCRKGGAAKEQATVLIAHGALWFLQEEGDLFERNVVAELDRAGAEGRMRQVIWNALGYAAWNNRRLALTLGDSLRQEVRYREKAGDDETKDTGASRYATTATAELLEGHGSWKDWAIGGVEIRRRERIVNQICGHMWREENVAKRGGWKKVVRPLWDEILEEGGGTTEMEQGSFLRCFEKLDSKEAEEFAERFGRGPAVLPEWFLEERYGGRTVPNRKAAVDVFRHCAGRRDEGGADHWRWKGAVETLKAWLQEEEPGRLKDDIIDALASRAVMIASG